MSTQKEGGLVVVGTKRKGGKERNTEAERIKTLQAQILKGGKGNTPLGWEQCGILPKRWII
jgi:hypothetical protein